MPWHLSFCHRDKIILNVFSGLCYFASPAPLVWYQAIASCASREGRLAHPKTWKEWGQIIPDANHNYWTGEQIFLLHYIKYRWS